MVGVKRIYFPLDTALLPCNDSSMTTQANTELATQRDMTPMQMIQQAYQSAIERGAGLEVVNSIVAQLREERDYRDKQEFNAALRRIQDALKPIPKRGENPQTHSKFATAQDIDAQLDPLLQREGMTLSFEPEPTGIPDMMRVVAILSLGAYSRRYPLDMPCDGQGPKGGGVMSRTHATGSGLTLCKRYLKNAIFNLRFEELDDDGNAAGISEDSMILVNDIRKAKNENELTSAYREGAKQALAMGDKTLIGLILDAKNAKVKELKEGPNA